MSNPENIEVRLLKGDETINDWNTFVENNPAANLYQHIGWREVIEKTYAHKPYYLIALRPGNLQKIQEKLHGNNYIQPSDNSEIIGVLPLFHLKHFLFVNKLVSLPFCDMGGFLSCSERAAKELILAAVSLGRKLKVHSIELRQMSPISLLNSNGKIVFNDTTKVSPIVKSHKVRMTMDLPDSSEALMSSFRSKLRSQIKKPLREGLFGVVGGIELLDDFYHVFAKNMHDLGSPVHSKELIKNTLRVFHRRAKVFVVYFKKVPVAGSIGVGFRDTLANPWASALRSYNHLSPNMLLYWTMLEYACDNGYKQFDFGRSTPGEGTYNFKKQWGAKAIPLNWYSFSAGKLQTASEVPEKERFDSLVKLWSNLPVGLTRLLGPFVRKYIDL